MSRDIPEDLRRQVMKEVYRVADSVDWDGLTQPERSAWYDRWVDEPAIGDVLTRFLARERARVWIKDMAMKHYGRARAGIGPYKDLVTRRLPGPDQIAAVTFGADWRPIDNTMRDKPSRCHVTNDDGLRLMIWGTADNLRALVWAGLNAVVDGEPLPAIVITTRYGHKLTDGEMERHRSLGGQAGLDVRHITIRVVDVGAGAKSGPETDSGTLPGLSEIDQVRSA